MHILFKVYIILIDEESNSKYKSLTKSENVLSDSEEDLDHKDNYVNIKTDKNLRSSKEINYKSNYSDYLNDRDLESLSVKDSINIDETMSALKELYIHTNYKLEQNALPLMGNLWVIDALEIEKTLGVVNSLIKRHNADHEDLISLSRENNSLKSQLIDLK